MAASPGCPCNTVFEALHAGATLITAGRRLARDLARRYGERWCCGLDEFGIWPLDQVYLMRYIRPYA